MTSIKAPSLEIVDTYGTTFDAFDAKEFHTDGPATVNVVFPFGNDESAFSQFVRDEVDGVKLVLSAEAYERCMPPQFDVERAVKYLSKAPGVTSVTFTDNLKASGPAGNLNVHTADEASANLLRGFLRETVELPGAGISAYINVAPGEG